jgi:primosomal protein N' (replication factor Y) (superfamily II helicase)
MTAPRYADIVLPLPVDHPFTYAIPEALRDRAAIGMRAIVPVRKRIETGFITGLHEKAPACKTRDIIDLPDDEAVFSEDMIRLCRWIASYYCCALGEALQCAAPAGLRIGSQMQYRLLPDMLHQGRYTARQQKVIAALYRESPQTQKQIARHAGAQSLSNTLQALVRRGVLLAEPVTTKPGASIQTETWACLIEEAVPANDALAAMSRRAPKQAAVYLDLLHGESCRAATLLYEKHRVNAATLAALEKKGLIRREEREFYRQPDLHPDAASAKKLPLNAAQQEAFNAITEAIGRNTYQTFLLHGITGSGKTEVYLQAIEAARARNRTAIILVPEISLTPQTAGRFHARFREDIAVLHSGLSTGERYDEWRRAQRGEVAIVVGARSAIFAPLKNIGIIVVDEEHDTSYKQGDTPRYHARDAAIVRASMHNAVCVLGSATPSIESCANAGSGKFQRLELRERATCASLPEIALVDMRREAKETKGEIILSRQLEAAVNQCVAAGEQAILLLNRRGFAPVVLCPQCGATAECPDCNVTLTYHSSGGMIICHYCDYRRPRPEACESCGYQPLIFLGTGTQKAEDYLLRAFPGARIQRMDADTTSGKGGHAKILGQFAAGTIDILIGTQMLAKGHDYPGVTLVGVINADAGLSLPDFRAAEQTFQLLTQVAGRAGRGGRPGKVYIQTYRPNHYAVQAALNHDFDAFYAHEIEQRRAAGYPPFRRMVQYAIESEDPQKAERSVVLLRRLLRNEIAAREFRGIQVLGPAPAAIRRVRKKYRWNLAALSISAKRLNALTRAVREKFNEEKTGPGVALKIDFDPYGLF